MNIEVVRRLCLARHLHQLGLGSLGSANDLHLFSGVNLLQDAVEAFLLAVADFVGAGLDERTPQFAKYFDIINDKIEPKQLPFKNQLLRLNRLRVDSKHHGIQPARDECQRLAVYVLEFFDEVSTSVMGVSFATVSTIDLLETGETKEQLLEAKQALEASDAARCAICCRKAIYLEFERQYDVSEFKDGDKSPLVAALASEAPFYAKRKDYVDREVKDPTDFIVYDHTELEQKLLTQGIDTTTFWNVWRLTPEVYRFKDKTWVVKHEFRKLDSKTLNANIEYLFNATVDIILAIHSKRQSTRQLAFDAPTFELKEQQVRVYEKADTDSRIVGTTPEGVVQMQCDYRVAGLRGDGPYWHVYCFEQN